MNKHLISIKYWCRSEWGELLEIRVGIVESQKVAAKSSRMSNSTMPKARGKDKVVKESNILRVKDRQSLLNWEWPMGKREWKGAL